MSELHKFLFEGLPVRGMLVRLTDAWQELLRRRATVGGFAPPVRDLVGEMAAAATLLQANIKFNGSVVLQIMGDGPVKLAVAECRPDLSFRATAKIVGNVPAGAELRALLNVHGQGRCAITLDPQDRLPGQQPYQGVVPLQNAQGATLPSLAQVLEQYMRQSEQLETRLVLAANEHMAAGLLIQRLPIEGEANLGGQPGETTAEALAEGFNRIAHLAASLKQEELLTLDADTLLRRLFWEEDVRRFEPLHPRFACTCSRGRVAAMLHNLGREEADSIIAEQGRIEIGCDHCGAHYHFDAVDVGELFGALPGQAGSAALH
ncbi:molecular chaperone Hsp33 [Vitreoscilla filiformis]|uniref:Molecular chaperone Hsp33 n=1 Tax=Vitreoscilla filiformis TaxID=63 RepID=A0A221KGI1_VITFI|nr:Hsp33 family molecular chaperone HslO [Vitreoscilla filiformis]ASM78121.1 molecular chaperone Hsp33 [Vitreoscilla filiformis]